MILYADTSALLKLYIREAGREMVQEAIAAAQIVATHLVAYPELRAALRKAKRMGRIGEGHLDALVADVDRDWPLFQILSVDATLAKRAGELAHDFELRGYDSVHLAAAEAVAAQVAPAPFRFAAFDDALTRAATSLGLSLIDER